MHLWVEPAVGEQKSAEVEGKTVTLTYPEKTIVDGTTKVQTI
jgi:hypothetical protein